VTISTDTMLRIGRERWASWLKHPGYDDVPFARPSLGIVCKELLDRGILALMSGTSGFWARPRDVEAYVKEEVARAVELYGEEGWLADPASYHVRPPGASTCRDQARVRLAEARAPTLSRASTSRRPAIPDASVGSTTPTIARHTLFSCAKPTRVVRGW
jgi:hypothetical protein